MFSPYYAWARRRGAADPLNHCAFNIVVHDRGRKRWAMTERGTRTVQREPQVLTIGPSALRVDGRSLIFRIDERSSPWPSPIRGEVRVTPKHVFSTHYPLDRDGRHRWHPIAPISRIDVALDAPSMQWSGDAYCDSNDGDEPLADRMRSWHWMRGTVDGDAVILYDARDRSGTETSHALRFSQDGQVTPFEPPPLRALPSSKWRLSRRARADDGAITAQSLDDTPFYVRSIVSAALCGQRIACVHESLDLDRFRSPIVQAMLPFRMRRNA